MLKFVFTCILIISFTLPSQASDHKIHISGDGHYKKTLSLWDAALTTNELGGFTWFGTITGNGHKDRLHKNKKRTTIIYAPEWFNPLEPSEVIFWFHGCGGFGKRTFETRTLGHVSTMTTENFIFVIPEMPWSQNTSTRCGRQRKAWNGASHNNIKTFFDGVVANIKKFWNPLFDINATNITMIGHSAGGSAIANAATSGGLDYIQPTNLVFSDAGYGRWTDRTWKYYVRKNTHVKFLLFVRKWDKPYRQTMRFLKGFRIKPKNIHPIILQRKVYTHGRIGDESLSMRGAICEASKG